MTTITSENQTTTPSSRGNDGGFSRSSVSGPVIALPMDQCVADAIGQQVQRTPDRVALVCGNRRLTYRELDHRANALAAELQARGVTGDVPVGLCVNRSIGMMAALLGILKSGGCYLPLDPKYPVERIAFMLQDAKPPVLLTERNVCERLNLGAMKAGANGSQSEPGRFERSPQVLCLDEMEFSGQVPSALDRPRSSSDRQLSAAYVIYTSGSTGKPKGVIVTQRNVINFFSAMDRVLGAGSESGVWLAFTSICFDISVLELFWTLARGFTVVIGAAVTSAEQGGGGSISEQILQHRVTHFQCTPSHAASLVRERFVAPALRQLNALVVGGEALPAGLAAQLREMLRGRLINMYGPTETTVWSACHEIEKIEGSVPIGRPVANTEIHILDEDLRRVPIGEAGEISIGGEGVARGYFNRPELTAQKFISVQGTRLYRTGDIGRLRTGGRIQFLGRADQQVKVRGHRIELGEIEAALRRVPGVRECAVRVWEFAPDDKRLAAYLISQSAGTCPTADELRRALQSVLPDFMIPSTFTFLDTFPLTPNGKLDRNALPKPPQARPSLQTEFVAPAAGLEDAIAGIWRDLLRLEEVGCRDNFFDLGGTSLLMAEMQVRLRDALKMDLPIVRLFERPTIRALAEFLASRNSSSLTEARRRAQRQRESFGRSTSQPVSA